MQSKFLHVLVEGPSQIMEIHQQKARDSIPVLGYCGGYCVECCEGPS